VISIATSSIFREFTIEDDEAADRLIALKQTKHVYMDIDNNRDEKKKLLLDYLCIEHIKNR
jgi:hypothetical protein